MVAIDILTDGIPGWTSHGALGLSTVLAVEKETILDAGAISQRGILLDGLRSAGIDPEEVQHVLLSHLHWDHVQNLPLFPNATVHVFEPGLDRLRSDEPLPHYFETAKQVLADRDPVTFDAGTVRPGIEAIPTPGHARHQVSFAFENEPGVLFAADAVKSVAEFVAGDPHALDDESDALASYDRIRSEFDFVIPGHDRPFYLEDGRVVPTGDVDFGVGMQFGTEADTVVEVSSSRAETRPLPDNVTDHARTTDVGGR